MALDFFAGCVGGCAGILVGHPLDTIKVRLQTQDFRNPVYRGTFHCFQTILQKESVSGLYRGMSSPMGGVALINAIVFGVYGNAQRRMSNPDSLSTHFLAGFSAGLAQSFVCSPMELAKIRMQVQQGNVYRGALHCLVQVTRTGGVRSLYRGLGLTMARDAPAMGVYFLSYEMMTRPFSSGQPLSTMHVMIAGGLAGSMSWIATFPMDVLKSRLQMDGMYGSAKYSGTLDCLRQSLRSEGYSFIVRGLTSTLIRAFPVNAATFAGVTWVFRLAGVGNTDTEESGYFVASQYEEDTASVKVYRHVSEEDVWGLKISQLWSNWENTALKGLFHWRKLMVHNIEDSFFLDDHDISGLSAKFVNNDLPQTESTATSLSPEQLQSSLIDVEDSDDDTSDSENKLEPLQIECSHNTNQESQHKGFEFSSNLVVDNSERTIKEKYR